MARVDFLSNVLIFKHDKFQDLRGELYTLWKQTEINNLNFNHDKIARSKKNVIRGLHTDKSWKLITCIYGKLQLVVANSNSNSKDYLCWTDFILDSQSKEITSILIPPGFYNGHLILSDEALFYYKWCYEGDYPDVENQNSIKWDEPLLNINWLCDNPILSDRDKYIPYIKCK